MVFKERLTILKRGKGLMSRKIKMEVKYKDRNNIDVCTPMNKMVIINNKVKDKNQNGSQV